MGINREGTGADVNDVVVYMGLLPPVEGKRFLVTHRVTGVEPGLKPDEFMYMLKDAGYPFEVPGGSAFKNPEDKMLYFHADWLTYEYERCIGEDTVVVSWEELQSKLER